ncbi:hypothetical protein NCLIV_012020 [Neospora caninum Liverpool]|uniref:Uncharacterized protein n=1 Tax=Neospora caninum (strain Liverpool) TaxID=572307 RepID=F0V9X3_NEOCL|nr:hypothetical protein NCLIV_012020 [Neospora caninum Liverpool]CBZ50735.1 hypothetical protein NCLIV_012020 [Neospora caninum Liverpool]CEL65347.1 TPA: hypothetical protein BN1204_012020 [Neospora caninum Liverpool]|eukprot:XP_003880768.1 hypothetical protein NCLIV_012020 [Neospora caninum Liverpool]
MRRGSENFRHLLASRAGLLLVACCACALLSSAPLPTRRYFLTFGLASEVVVDGEAEKGNLDVSVQQDGRDNGDADSLDPIDGSPAAAVEAGGLAAVQQQGRSSRGSSVSYTVSTQRMASKSRYVLPAVLISALAAAGMMGYVTPKKTPASQKADVQTVAARAGAEQFDSAATKKKSAEIAQETEESRRRRKQAALVAAVLVAAAVYGLRSSLLGVDKVSSPTALQGLLKKPESMHGIDPDASVDFQPDASVERQMEVPAEGAGDAVRGWQHLVRDFSAMLAGEYALSPRVGAVASAVALGLLAFSLAAARRASRRRQQQGEERPASPTAGEEQADPVPAEAADPAADPEQVGEKEPKKPEEKEAPAAPAAPAAEPEEILEAEPEKPEEEVALVAADPAAEPEQIPEAEPEEPEEEVALVAADPAAEPEQIPEAEPEKPEVEEAPAAAADPAAELEEILEAEPEKLEEEAPAAAADPAAELEEIPEAEPEKPEEEVALVAADPAAEPEQIPEAEPEKPEEEEVPPVAADPAAEPEEILEAEPEKLEEEAPAAAADPAAEPEEIPEAEPEKPEEEAPAAAADPAAGPEQIPQAEPEKPKEDAAEGPSGEQAAEQAESGTKEERGEREEEEEPSGEEPSEAAGDPDDDMLDVSIADVREAALQQAKRCGEFVSKFRIAAYSLEIASGALQTRIEIARQHGQDVVVRTMSDSLTTTMRQLELSYEAMRKNVDLGRLAQAVASLAETVEQGQRDGVIEEQIAPLEQKMDQVMSELDELVKESETEDTEEEAAVPGVTGSPSEPRAPSTDDIKNLRHQLKRTIHLFATTVVAAQADASTSLGSRRKLPGSDISDAIAWYKSSIATAHGLIAGLHKFGDPITASVAFFTEHVQQAEDDLTARDVPGDSPEVQKLKDELERRRQALARTEAVAAALRRDKEYAETVISFAQEHLMDLQFEWQIFATSD